VAANKKEAKAHQVHPRNRRVTNAKEKIKDLIQKVIRATMENMDTVMAMVSVIIMNMVIVMENIDKINLQVQLIKL
jgi:hypothetical protein